MPRDTGSRRKAMLSRRTAGDVPPSSSSSSADAMRLRSRHSGRCVATKLQPCSMRARSTAALSLAEVEPQSTIDVLFASPSCQLPAPE